MYTMDLTSKEKLIDLYQDEKLQDTLMIGNGVDKMKTVVIDSTEKYVFGYNQISISPLNFFKVQLHGKGDNKYFKTDLSGKVYLKNMEVIK